MFSLMEMRNGYDLYGYAKGLQVSECVIKLMLKVYVSYARGLVCSQIDVEGVCFLWKRLQALGRCQEALDV